MKALPGILVALGIVTIAAGVALYSFPAGLIVLGVGCIFIGWSRG